MKPEDMSTGELKDKISVLESELSKFRDELNRRRLSEETMVEERIRRNAVFSEDELVYAAYARCECGLGMAYPKKIGMFGSWYCSGMLTHTLDHSKTHSSPLPFAMWEVKSEDQPSANGASTRPKHGTS